MPKIRQLSARNLHESWVTIPHVTHFDEADITDLEDFRKTLNQRRDHETKVTPLAFFVKAVTLSLRAFPQFNASLSPDFTEWVFKDFINIGIAVETEGGLVVPNIKSADQLGLTAIAGKLPSWLSRRDQKNSCRNHCRVRRLPSPVWVVLVERGSRLSSTPGGGHTWRCSG